MMYVLVDDESWDILAERDSLDSLELAQSLLWDKGISTTVYDSLAEYEMEKAQNN